MSVSYKKLWHLLLDRDMKKKDLVELSGISSYTINKLNSNGNVTVEVLEKTCNVLDCTLDHIMEFEEDEKRKVSDYFGKENKERNFYGRSTIEKC